MSAINFCDVGHHAYSSSEIGSQNITATTVFRHSNGQLDSRSERFDVCKAHALRTPNSEEYISVTGADEKSEDAKVIENVPNSLTDRGGDVWLFDRIREDGEALYKLPGLEARTRKAVERDYGITDTA